MTGELTWRVINHLGVGESVVVGEDASVDGRELILTDLILPFDRKIRLQLSR